MRASRERRSGIAAMHEDRRRVPIDGDNPDGAATLPCLERIGFVFALRMGPLQLEDERCTISSPHGRDERGRPTGVCVAVERERPRVELLVEPVDGRLEPGGGGRITRHPLDGRGSRQPDAQASTSMPIEPPR